MIRISEDAFDDLNQGFLFYESQAIGLGDYFVTCLRADIEALRITAGIHPVIYRDYHRSLSRVFPFGIFDTVGADDIVVWAVVDLRRHPQWIAEHLRQTGEG
ncbi:MAG: type II toxin-antitoxin system RelE/ParE family toxin [Chthoniobacterales bacterium]